MSNNRELKGYIPKIPKMEICDFLKSWKRMCKAMTEMNGCEDCQIVRNTHSARCGDMPCEMNDVESIVREVEKWAAEHPEPAYPTFGEWLEKQGIVKLINSDRYDEDGRKVYVLLESVENQIPEDIAQKLGIEPKNG